MKRKYFFKKLLTFALTACIVGESVLGSSITSLAAMSSNTDSTTESQASSNNYIDASSFADITQINQDTFPDEHFMEYISETIDTDSDGFLSDEEKLVVTEIDVSNMFIQDLTGIKFFSNLESLNCSLNILSSLDLGGLSKLKSLDCSWNNIRDIILDNCSSLKEINAEKNAYIISNKNTSSPKVATGPAIIDAQTLSENNFDNSTDETSSFQNNSENIPSNTVDKKTTEVNITSSSSISIDLVAVNSIKETSLVNVDDDSFPDVTFREYISNIADRDNDNILDESELEEVTYLYLDDLNISNLTGIEYFKNIVYLSLNNNQVELLNVSDFTYLLELYCNNNRLTSLDVSQNANLDLIQCEENSNEIQMTSTTSIDLNTLDNIDVSKISDISVGTIDENGILTLSSQETAALNTDNLELTYTYNVETPKSSSPIVFTLDVTPYGATQSYTVTFDTRGGSYVPPQTVEHGKTASIPENPIRNGYTLKESSGGYVKWYDESGSRWFFKTPVVSNMTLHCLWDAINYSINYELNGGELSEDSQNSLITSCTVEDGIINLPSPQRKQYRFDGWYADSNFKNRVTSLDSSTAYCWYQKYVNPTASEDDYADTGYTISLYAKWVKIEAPTPTISSLKYSKKGTAKIAYSTQTKVSGYEIQLSTSKSFSAKTTNKIVSTKTSYTVNNLLKKSYYFKVRSYVTDDYGNKIYSPFSTVSSVKVKSGVKEYSAKASSAKISSCKLTSANEITVKAKISKRIKSSDASYYLVKVEPATGKVVGKPIASAAKTTSATFTIPVSEKNKANLMAKYAVAIKSGSKYKIISTSSMSYISNPEKAATNTMAFPVAASKKGIQATSHVAAKNLNAKHTLFNLNLDELISTSKSGDAYVYNGKTYYFHSPIDPSVVSYCNKNGITVSFVLLMQYNSRLKYMIHPSARKMGAAPYYLINTTDKKSRETLEAAFMYLTEKFGQKDCYVSNWILGNEVNIHSMWNYSGNMSLSKYAREYARAFKTLYYASKTNWSNARCYISLDHSWNNADGGFGGKEMLSAFNSALKKENKNIKWNLAYHAYPVPLTEPAFWNNSHTSKSVSSDYITLKNLSVLTKYISKTYGKNTRIILSEQGFTSTSGQSVQAAAIAYGYYLSEFNSMIDAFIIRSDIDFDVEVAQGLAFGITGKKAENVFKYMDTPNSETYTKPYLKTIKAKSWKSVVPGYKASKFKSMPSI